MGSCAAGRGIAVKTKDAICFSAKNIYFVGMKGKGYFVKIKDI
jgi:hypothetical protein